MTICLKNLKKYSDGALIAAVCTFVYCASAFVGISIDNSNDYEKWETMVKNGDVDGIQLFSNNDHKFTEAYDIKAIPRFMLFNPEGKVVNINMPYPSTGELKDLLNSIVK